MEHKKMAGVEEINLIKLMQVLMQKLWAIILSGIVVGLIVLGVTKAFVQPKFTSGVMLYVNNSKDRVVNNITSADISASIMLANTYLTIIQSDTILEEVLLRSGSEMPMEEFKLKIRAANVSNTEVLAIQITTNDPEEAALLADNLADVVTEQLPDIVEGSSVKILEQAKVPEKKSSPSYSKRTIIGGFVGCFAAMLLIIILDILDNRIRSEKDLERWDYPVLGVIPDMMSKDSTKTYYSKTYSKE